ncbi:hypothetical protein AB6A40_009891 [Gnathostoma spinigerum]|uniref:Uncharacterized protein n=1 Tax=Gnathostoma spinigerum TaxID=75299 RepID=A0ABD6F1N7_9BILA
MKSRRTLLLIHVLALCQGIWSDNGCSKNEFKCAIDGKCIPLLKVQDGIHDCLDGSDEGERLSEVRVERLAIHHAFVANAHLDSRDFISTPSGNSILLRSSLKLKLISFRTELGMSSNFDGFTRIYVILSFNGIEVSINKS